MKRLILCADGTWNVRDQIDDVSNKRRPTNVTKTARSVLARDSAGIDQIVYYHDGVGTHAGLDKLTGGAFGRGIESNVRELYRFLVYNYQAGDEIYLFGFSRGAFTVRTLVGFMNRCGLVGKGDDFYVPDIYACYETSQGEGTAQWQAAFRKVTTVQPCPPITFIGVWDTVGALGAPGLLGRLFNRNKYKYHDVDLNGHILHAAHAVSIDEHRGPFIPNLWTKPAGWNNTLEQAWFPGVHCGVGGGYDPDGIANEALHWVIEKAEGHGLAVDAAYLQHYAPVYHSTFFESMTWKYRLFSPNVRKIGHLGTGEEALHQAALDRLNDPSCNYRPKNLVAALARNPPLPVVTTRRIPRGWSS